MPLYPSFILRISVILLAAASGRVRAAEIAPLAKGDWEQHGFTAEQRAQIRAGFQKAIDAKAVPGASLLLIHKGEMILHRPNFRRVTTAQHARVRK